MNNPNASYSATPLKNTQALKATQVNRIANASLTSTSITNTSDATITEPYSVSQITENKPWLVAIFFVIGMLLMLYLMHFK